MLVPKAFTTGCHDPPIAVWAGIHILILAANKDQAPLCKFAEWLAAHKAFAVLVHGWGLLVNARGQAERRPKVTYLSRIEDHASCPRVFIWGWRSVDGYVRNRAGQNSPHLPRHQPSSFAGSDAEREQSFLLLMQPRPLVAIFVNTSIQE